MHFDIAASNVLYFLYCLLKSTFPSIYDIVKIIYIYSDLFGLWKKMQIMLNDTQNHTDTIPLNVCKGIINPQAVLKVGGGGGFITLMRSMMCLSSKSSLRL